MAITQIKTTGIADDAVTVAKMADNSIDSDQYVDGSIDTAHIADSQITVAKMAANSIDSDQYVDGSIDTAHLANDAVTADKVADNAIDVARLNVSDGSAGQSLTTNGSGALAFATISGAYNTWLVKTGNYTALVGDQLVVNSASATTITLPASASAGNTVIIKATGGGLVTIGRNSQNINSTAADGALSSGSSTQLVFVDSTIGFLEI